MKKSRKWVYTAILRIILAAAAFAFQLPQVDDLIIHLLYPKAGLVSQASLGGAIHYVQAAAFGGACVLIAETVLSLVGRLFGIAFTIRRHKRQPAKEHAPSSSYYKEIDDAA